MFESSSEDEAAAGSTNAASGNNAASSGSEGEESSEDDIDFEFPREDAAELLQFLHREVTNLSNLEDN